MEHLLQFINPANAPQNTGGGTSQTSAFVTTAKKGSRPTVNRQSTDGQSQGHYTHTPLCKALKYAAMLLMVLTLGIGNAWGDVVWQSDMQETISGVTQTKVNASDSWDTNLSLAWASGFTKAYRPSGDNRGVTLAFDTPLSLQTGNVIRVFVGSTNGTARTFSLFVNNGGSAVATASSAAATLRVIDYTLTSNVTLNSIKITASKNDSYIFKVIIFGEKPSTGETTISFEMTKGAATVQGRTDNCISTISGLSTSIACTGLTTDGNNGQNSLSGTISSQPAAESASHYADLQFTVASGYTFTPSSVSMKWAGNSTSLKAKVSILDGTTTVTSNESTISNSSVSLANAQSVTFASGTFTGKAFAGTVHIRIYMYGKTGQRAYLAVPFSITGTVAAAGGGGGGECTDADPGLAYATDEVEKTNGDAKFTNTLTNSHSVTVSYESSDEDVATVDAAGEVTIKTYGSVTITASNEAGTYGGTDYCADEASYTLTINKRSYAISYAAGDAEGVTGSKAAESKTEDEAFTLPSSAVFERDGYVQLGWNTDSDGENGDHYDLGGSYETNAAQTFYPEWTAAHTLTYNANGGTGSMANTVSAGTITLRANAYTKDGYVFAGWATSQANADAGTIAYADAATTYSLSADATLYAVWYTVYYSFAPTGEVSSTSLSADDVVASSTGGSMTYTPADGGSPTLKYSSNGLEFGGASQCQVTVTLNTATAAGDIIEAKVYTGAATARGLKIANSDGTAKADFSYTAIGDHIGVYTIVANDKIAEATTFKVLRNNNAYLKSLKVAKWVAPEPSCDATAPGNINKGTASGGTGKITLTVTGSPETGDKWYWQEDEDGEDDEDEYDAENGKEVSAAGTYYLRSYNTAGDCWSTAKSVTVTAADLLTAPTATFSDGAYVVGASALDLSTLWSSNSNGAVTYVLKVASDDASVTTGAFSATKAGSYVVTASQAATSTYSVVEKEATITVTWPATGEATILYNVAVGTSNTALGTASTDDNSASISNLSNFTAAGDLTVTGLGAGKDGLSTKLQTLSAKDVSKYIYVTFDVASGKEFVLDSVVTYIVAVSNAKTIEVVMNDTEGTKDSLNYSQAKNSEAAKHVFDFTSSAKAYEGTVTLKLYAYGDIDHYRLGQPLKICGTVATKVVKYDLSFAKGSEYASGTMTTVKYAEDAAVTLPACTFTAPTGKEFDAWVVTETVSGDAVTVTDGAFTMPAVAVTATATWKDRPKHTDATLSDLTVAGETVDDFDAATTSYNVELPFGTFAAPTVAATATDASYVKSVNVTQASSATGDATVVVTAEDGSTTKTYTVHFSVADSKDIRMVWKTTGNPCGESSAPTAVVLSTNDAIKDYLSISFVQTTETAANQAEEKSGSYLSTGKSIGNLVKITAKPGYAFKNMSFYGKIETDEVKCPISIDGGETWTDVTGTVGSDAQHCDVFTDEEVHEIILKNNAGYGTWLRHMDLTMIQACTPKTIAWTTAPASEYEVGKAGYAIAASANNGTVTYAASNAAITVNESTGALTINSLTNDIDLSASVPAGDGTLYCATSASVVKEEIKTYYLVTFDAQNETAATTAKYYSGDAAISLPSPSYSGYVFQGWFDAATGGTRITEAITPTASRTVYAQWEAQCAGPTITAQPASANYFVGRTPTALSCEATAGDEGELTYTWYSCDDALRTNPVELDEAPTPSTAAAGTFYYYCVVTEAGCAVERTSDVATITVSEKDMLCLIQATHKNATEATIAGYIGGTADKNTQGGSKLGSKGHYFGIQLASGTFQAGDVVLLRTADGADTNGDKVRIFKSNAASAENVLVEGTEAMIYGDNYVTLPETSLNQLYLRRGTDEENYNKDWNPYIAVFAVYRPFPKPLLTGIKIDEAVAVVDELDATVYNVTIPAGSDLASLDVVPTFLSNDPSQTNGEVTSNEGAWVVGLNTYVVTDKDGDSKSYTINVARDVAVESVSVSGETTVAAKSQITLTATVLPAEVSNKAVTWSSSDETKATVDANGVVTGKAAGSVTITATSVADNMKKGTKEITVTKFVGTEYAYWFAYAADATANGVTNNSEVFGSAPTGTTDGAKEITLEEGWVVNTTKKAGSSTLGSFTVPADFTATLYVVVKGSGSSGRYIQLKQSDVVKYTSEEFGSADPAVLKIDGVAAGTYTIANVGGLSNFYLYAAELNSYPLTSVALEEGFNLRLEQSRTPVFTITPAKAAVASQVWSVVSRTGASDANLNTSTGEITAGTEEGTLTVKVSVTDAFGNEVESGNCVVKIVNIIDQKDVTGSMTWNWTGAGTANVAINNEEALVLGNYIDGDQWAYLKGTNGDQAYHHESSYGSYQGKGTLSFKTTVPGLVTITARRISNNADLKIGEDVVLSLESSNKTSKAFFVPAGEVNIIADATDGMRILKIEFDAEPTVDKIEGSHFGGYERTVDPKYYGTICLPKDGIMVGATIFKVAHMTYENAQPYKVFFDEVINGVMEAGMPYIFLTEQSTIGVYYTGTTEVTAGNELDYNGLHGTLSLMDGDDLSGKYIFYNNSIFMSENPQNWLNANRAYIVLSEVPDYVTPLAPGRRRVSMGFNGAQTQNTATGLDAITNDQSPITNKVLINGQFFILRGEKLYDATGRLVK